MHLSVGWVLFLGGVAGFIKVFRAVNLADVGIGDKPKDRSLPKSRRMTRQTRLLLLALNLLFVIWGAVWIHRNHNWDPFKPCPSCKLDNDAVS